MKLIRPQEVWHPLVHLKTYRDPGKYDTILFAREVTRIDLVHVAHFIFFTGTSLKPSAL